MSEERIAELETLTEQLVERMHRLETKNHVYAAILTDMGFGGKIFGNAPPDARPYILALVDDAQQKIQAGEPDPAFDVLCEQIRRGLPEPE